MDPDDDDAFQGFMDQSGDAGVTQATEIKRKISGAQRTPSENDYLRKALKANLRVVKVRKDRLRAAHLSPEDLAAADRWRKQCLRVMGVLRNRMVHQGGILSVSDYIRSKQGGVPVPCFRQETSGRGFEVVISIDMSSSMSGRTFAEVERLVLILRKALDFPFVKMKAQGWSSKESGGIVLYDYPDCRGNEGLITPESKPGGVTPLSHAVQLAGRALLNSRNERHIFLLSDGYPVYRLKGRSQYMKTEALREWTRDAVMDLRRRRINVWCWMIGRGVPDDKSMDFMFGPKRWKKINVDEIYQDGFEFLSEQFLTYLKSR